MPVFGSRLSGSKSVKNLSPFMEPYRDLDIKKDMKSKLPFLILKYNQNTDENFFINSFYAQNLFIYAVYTKM